MKKYRVFNDEMSIIVDKPDGMTRQQLRRNMVIKYGTVRVKKVRDNNE
jgi:hypothetical protein